MYAPPLIQCFVAIKVLLAHIIKKSTHFGVLSLARLYMIMM
jgi:hypothetical protein